MFWHNVKSLINYSNYLRSNILTEPSAPTEANMSLPPPARLNAMSYTCNMFTNNIMYQVLHENATTNIIAIIITTEVQSKSKICGKSTVTFILWQSKQFWTSGGKTVHVYHDVTKLLFAVCCFKNQHISTSHFNT